MSMEQGRHDLKAWDARISLRKGQQMGKVEPWLACQDLLLAWSVCLILVCFQNKFLNLPADGSNTSSTVITIVYSGNVESKILLVVP